MEDNNQQSEDYQKPQIDTPTDFEDEQFSDLKSSMSWEDLMVPGPLADRLIQLGFKSPSKIQELVIPASFKSSVFAQSKNGSGKTLSFLVPAILFANPQEEDINSAGVLCPQVVILADTRALITQIEKLATKLSTCSHGLKIGFSFSGVAEGESNDTGHIFITTVKRISNLLNKKKIDLTNLKLIILDEADQVMQGDSQDKFIPKLFLKILPLEMRTILTSATVTPMTSMLVDKTDQFKHFKRIEVKKEELTLQNVQQYFIRCSEQDRTQVLDMILDKLKASNILIFTNARKVMQDVMHHLAHKGERAVTVSSNVMEDRAQEARINQNCMDMFMQGQYRVLLTTNLLSRGIDMRKVSLVINLELPVSYSSVQEGGKPMPKGADHETYLHRVGRTGRFGDQGIALNIISSDQQMTMLEEIIGYYDIDMKELKADLLNDLNSTLDEISQFNKQKRDKLEEAI